MLFVPTPSFYTSAIVTLYDEVHLNRLFLADIDLLPERFGQLLPGLEEIHLSAQAEVRKNVAEE